MVCGNEAVLQQATRVTWILESIRDLYQHDLPLQGSLQLLSWTATVAFEGPKLKGVYFLYTRSTSIHDFFETITAKSHGSPTLDNAGGKGGQELLRVHIITSSSDMIPPLMAGGL